MPLILLKFWRECIIAVLAFLLLVALFVIDYRGNKLKIADTKCAEKIQEIEQKHIKELAEKQNAINKVSVDYEKAKSEQRVKVETITKEVQKIVERPVYINECFDDDGLSELNSLITSSASEPP